MPRILLFDDERAVLTLCVRILESVEGLDILTASDGLEALEVASRYDGHVDLLVSDVVLGAGPNGFELAQRLSASRHQTKVLLMSAYFSGNTPLEHEWYFISKPFQPADLRTLVHNILSTPASA